MGLFDNVQRFYTLSVCSLTARDGKFQRDVYEAVRRFKQADWGEISEADKDGNNEAIKSHDMVLGAYETSQGRIWIIAESSTGEEYDRLTVLFPNEH